MKSKTTPMNDTQSKWFTRPIIILPAIIAIGTVLRAYGLFWDKPHFFNPDEGRLLEWGIVYNHFEPISSEWGALPQLIIKTIYATLSLFYTPDTAALYPFARGLSVLVGSATMLLVYLLAKQAYNQPTALLAAAFTAFTVLFIQNAHFYNLDGLFTFFMLLALFPILAVAQHGHLKQYLLAGLLIGLTTAVRLNGLFLVGPLVVAHGYAVYNRAIGNTLSPQKIAFTPDPSPKGRGESAQHSLSRWERVRVRANFHPLGCSPDWMITPQKNKWLIFKPAAHTGLLLAFAVSLITFVILTPAVILNPYKYLFYDGLVWVMLQSAGYIKSRYTLQFEGVTPLYYFSNLLYWSAGSPLLLAYVVGAIYALVNWRRKENILFLSLLFLFIWTGAGARVKFIRYVLPVLPLLNILAASFFVSILAGVKNSTFLRWSVGLWLGGVIIATALYALAFTNIYSRPDPRTLAGEWMQNNIPAGATIARGSNDYRRGLFEVERENAVEFRLNKINFDRLYASSQPALESRFPPILKKLGIEVTRRGQDSNFDDEEDGSDGSFTPLSLEEKEYYIGQEHYCADYVIFTERNYDLYRNRADLFPAEHAYFTRLFNGELGFQLVKMFERKPNLFDLRIDDRDAELTFRLFDHPTVWIFQAQLSPEFLQHQPPAHNANINWADRIQLVGYTIAPQKLQPGREIELTLYWQALTGPNENYVIVVEARDQASEVAIRNEHQVASGILPTSCWQPGRVIVDKITLLVSAQAAPGPYLLQVGLRRFDPPEYLPIANNPNAKNLAELTTIQIIYEENLR
jgi:hypothetical protein